MTEDADLGFRLHRLGWRTGTITLPTLEDAPGEYSVWLQQRSRWFKGWLQTLFVHSRNPRKLHREIGVTAVLCFLGTNASILFSALAHPVLLLTTALTLSFMLTDSYSSLTTLQSVLLLIDCANLTGSYAIFIALGQLDMSKPEKRKIGKRWLATPFYWMLISHAAWRSTRELWKSPHHWNKTPHEPSRRASQQVGK